MMTERERFEAWAQSRNMGLGAMVDGSYYHTAADEAWAAWQARCPEGWQVVPVEPTMSILEASGHENSIEAAARWAEQLAAAPQPGEEA